MIVVRDCRDKFFVPLDGSSLENVVFYSSIAACRDIPDGTTVAKTQKGRKKSDIPTFFFMSGVTVTHRRFSLKFDRIGPSVSSRPIKGYEETNID